MPELEHKFEAAAGSRSDGGDGSAGPSALHSDSYPVRRESRQAGGDRDPKAAGGDHEPGFLNFDTPKVPNPEHTERK